MSLLLKNRKIITNLIYFKTRSHKFSFCNSTLLNSKTEKNEMDQLKSNPYFEKYKTKIKTVFE